MFKWAVVFFLFGALFEIGNTDRGENSIIYKIIVTLLCGFLTGIVGLFLGFLWNL